MRRIKLIFLTLLLTLSLSIPNVILANDDIIYDMADFLTSVEVYDSFDDYISSEDAPIARGAKKPTETWNLAGGSYDFEGSTYGDQNLWFNYWFSNHNCDANIKISSN